MPAQLPPVKLEFECVTRPGDPARTRTCTFSAPRDLRPSKPYLWLSAISVHGRAGRRRRSTGCACPYRILLIEQKFVVIHANVSEVQLENVTSVRALHPANTDCPECKGKGEVPQHGGLRQKSCWRCAGRGWLRTPIK